MNQIGTLTEKSLHAGIKQSLYQKGDELEVSVDGYVIDIVRGDWLIEIQTGNFTQIKPKLSRLLPNHPILLVYPLPQEKWIVRQTAVGEFISRRKSPKRGRVVDVFDELVRIPHLLAHPNLRLRVLLTQQEEILRDDGQGSWRRKRWSLYDHRLLAIVQTITFTETADFLSLLPADLPLPFTNRELATKLSIRLRLAQRITYTLRHCGALTMMGKKGKANLYASTSPLKKANAEALRR